MDNSEKNKKSSKTSSVLNDVNNFDETKSAIKISKKNYLNEKLRELTLTILSEISQFDLEDELRKELIDFNKIDEDEFWIKFKQIFYKVDKNSSSNNDILTFVILVNLTRNKDTCNAIYKSFEESKLIEQIEKLMKVEEAKKITYYSTCIFLNLTQLDPVRSYFNENINSNNILESLIESFYNFYLKENYNLVTNLIGSIKNLCFDMNIHSKLLNEESSFLVKLVYPITGPTSIELDDEDNEALPLELQYLDKTKKRSECFELNKTILECLLLLCSTSFSRIFLRKKKVYYILREYHKKENNSELINSIENVVDILLKEEYEYDDFKNLLQVEVSEELCKKFEKMNND